MCIVGNVLGGEECACIYFQEIWKPGQEVVAVYDFKGTTREDLPFCKGDVLTIVKSTRVSALT